MATPSTGPSPAPSWVTGATNAGTTTAGQITMVNLAAAQILNQDPFPKLDVPILSDLNAHLTLAKGHATTWKTKTSVKLLDEVQSLIFVGGLFQGCYADIQPLLLKMGNATTFDPAITSQIVYLLAPLQKRTADEATAANTRYGDIKTFHGQVMADSQTFTTDYDNAIQAIGSQSELRKQLTAELDQLNTRISHDDMTWGFGSAGMVVGGLVVACGVLLEIPTAGASTIIVASGAAIIAAGGLATAYGVVDRIKALEKKQETLTKIAQDDAEVGLIEAARGHLGELSTKIDTLNDSVQQVLTAWQDLDSGLQLVLSGVQRPEDRLAQLQRTQPTARPCDVAAEIAEELEAADDEWGKALPILNGLVDKNANVEYVSVVDTKQLPSPDVIAQAYARAA